MTRGKGEGSIYRRADGRWVGSVEAGRTATGKRRRRYVVRKTKREVLTAVSTLAQQVREGTIPDNRRTAAQFLEFWLSDVAAGNVSDSTLTEYAKRIRRIVPIIGHVRLAKLTTPHIQAMVTQLVTSDQLAPKTVNVTVDTLGQALRWAVAAQLIHRDPVQGVRRPRGISHGAKIDETLTPDEARRVLAYSLGNNDELHALWWLSLRYGLRQSELLNLRWSDIGADELTVRQSKTVAGQRTLPLLDDAKTVLDQHRRRHPGVARGLVFHRRDGRAWSGQMIRYRWKRLLEEAGVPHRRFHITRHTAATMLLEAGVPLEVVSAILGHSSIGITASIYTRIRSDLKRRGLQQLG